MSNQTTNSLDDILEQFGRSLGDKSLGSKRINRAEAIALAKRWLETSRAAISEIICRPEVLRNIGAGGKSERSVDLAAVLLDLHSAALSQVLGVSLPQVATLCTLIAKLGVAYFCNPTFKT